MNTLAARTAELYGDMCEDGGTNNRMRIDLNVLSLLNRYQPPMDANTPVTQPLTLAQNCALGLARSRCPVLKLCMTSVDCRAR